MLCFRLFSMSVAIPQVQFLVKAICPLLFRLVLLVRQCRKLRILRSCSPSLAVNIPFVPQTQFPIVQAIHQTTEIPQLLLIGRCSCCRVVQILRCCRGEALGAPTVAARREICDFLRPLVSDSHLFGVRVCLWRTRLWIFREMTPGIVSVLNTPRFDSGHIFGVSLRSLLEKCPSYFYAMLGSTVDTRLCVRLRRLVFSGFDAFCAVFLRCPQVPDACYHGRYGPEGMLCVAVQKTADSPQLQFIAGRRHLFRYAEAVSHGPGYSADHRDSPDVRIWWSMSLFVRSCRFSVLSVLRQSRSQSCGSSSSLSWRRGFPMVQTVADHCDFYLHVDKVVDAPVLQVVSCSHVDILSVVVQRQIPWSRLFV